MGFQLPRIFIKYSLCFALLGAFVVGGSISSHKVAHAGQPMNSNNIYSTVNPFDPSEVVNHSIKDEIRLRLRLPAPDLPPSIVASAPPQNEITSMPHNAKPSADYASLSKNADQPGLIGKSFQSVMSIFDWSNDKLDEPRTSGPVNSDEPIRINIHVGIKKSADENPDSAKTKELSRLKDPWARNQERVRRLFTFGEIKAHN